MHGGTRHRGQRGNVQPSCLLNHSLTGWTVLRRNLTMKIRPTPPGQHDWLDIVPLYVGTRLVLYVHDGFAASNFIIKIQFALGEGEREGEGTISPLR